MKINSNSILFFLAFELIIFFSSCCHEKDKYNYISDNERPIYSEGNNLIYRSNHGNLDTFHIIKVNKYFDFISYEGKCKEKGVYTENIVIYFSNKLDGYVSTPKIPTG